MELLRSTVAQQGNRDQARVSSHAHHPILLSVLIPHVGGPEPRGGGLRQTARRPVACLEPALYPKHLYGCAGVSERGLRETCQRFLRMSPLKVFPKTGAIAPAHARKPRCMLSPTRGIGVLSSLMLLPHVSGFAPLVHDEHVDG